MSQDLPITSYALLGLLAFGREADPGTDTGSDTEASHGMTGYELKQRADFTLRFYWVSPAMSQVYSELRRLTEHGLVQPSGRGRGRRYAITERGRRDLTRWLEETPPGFPVFKHPVALRLMSGHLTEPAQLRAMLEQYVEEVAAARADLADVRSSLAGADAPGEPFHHPSLVADWGLAHFDSEAAIARDLVAQLTDDSAADEEEP